MLYMKPWKRIALIVVMLVACVGCDQRAKYLAVEHLRGNEDISFLVDTIRLEYSENQGGFLSLGAFLPAPWRAAVFTIGCSAAIAALLWYTLLAARIGTLQVLGLSLICGGGIGNLVDRWTYSYARDFLNVGIGPIRTGIFNVADVAVIAGCVLLVLSGR